MQFVKYIVIAALGISVGATAATADNGNVEATQEATQVAINIDLENPWN